MLSLAYGCGLRAGEVVRLKVGGIDEDQKIIRIVQSKGPQGSQRDAARGYSGLVARVVIRTARRSGHRRGRA
ncbi:hypothetical protein METH_17400 [Leisingera methylohalidivorans DSM 14336]|uniref:Tyr recombinase domain-containing protein n=1 Tax=Leisingera methylohalidivorans DSM 14336 TaxID=999552 RepID=V9W236_9RHOB|nr:hypothetical protein METH_17400 [Leisingera methylohalidivorans DSM 14336]